MKKGKFLTALLACSMSVVAATACSFAVGCKKDKGGEGEGEGGAHQHVWSQTWSHDATNHWHECTAPGHTGAHNDIAVHVWENAQDTTCDTCGYVRTIGGGENPGTTNPPSTTKSPVTVDMADVYAANNGSVAGGTALGTNSGIKAWGANATVETNTKKSVYNGEALNATYRYKLDQTITNSDAAKAKGLEVKVEEAATVIVYAYSGSSGTARNLALYDAEKQIIAGKDQAIGDGRNDILGVAMFNVEANTTYYIGAKEAGVNVYYIAVVYGTLNETWGEEIAASDGDCVTKSNVAYHVSNYGRYYTTSATTLVYGGSVFSNAALGHQYTTPVTLMADLPTETSGATYTAHCVRPGCTTEAAESDKVINIPKLDDRGYTRTAGVADATNNYTYSITLDGIEFTFETVKVEPEALASVYTVNFVNSSIVGTYPGCSSWVVPSYKTSGFTAITYGGVTYTAPVKLASSAGITITLNENASIILYTDTNNGVRINGTAYTVTQDDTVYKTSEISLNAGEYTIVRNSQESRLLRIDIMPAS